MYAQLHVSIGARHKFRHEPLVHPHPNLCMGEARAFARGSGWGIMISE